jgi:hypothetical protein
MAEVLAEYSDTIVSPNGIGYYAQACGSLAADGRWEAWIEFEPLTGGAPIRTPRETTQPNQADAVYWATGLSAVYLEGALNRALNPTVIREAASPETFFNEPAPSVRRVTVPRPSVPAVLNPFSVYEKGEELLRRELGALSAWHLVKIIVAYRLTDEPLDQLNALPAERLIDRIIKGVREQTLIR